MKKLILLAVIVGTPLTKVFCETENPDEVPLQEKPLIQDDLLEIVDPVSHVTIRADRANRSVEAILPFGEVLYLSPYFSAHPGSNLHTTSLGEISNLIFKARQDRFLHEQNLQDVNHAVFSSKGAMNIVLIATAYVMPMAGMIHHSLISAGAIPYYLTAVAAVVAKAVMDYSFSHARSIEKINLKTFTAASPSACQENIRAMVESAAEHLGKDSQSHSSLASEATGKI